MLKVLQLYTLEWGYQWNGANMVCGWFDKGFAISKNCKNPDRAMELLDYLWSYDGSRLAYSGVKGMHWDIVDGVAKIKDEVIALKNENNDAWKKTGLRATSGGIYCGLGSFVINPADNTEVEFVQLCKFICFTAESLYQGLL